MISEIKTNLYQVAVSHKIEFSKCLNFHGIPGIVRTFNRSHTTERGEKTHNPTQFSLIRIKIVENKVFGSVSRSRHTRLGWADFQKVGATSIYISA